MGCLKAVLSLVKCAPLKLQHFQIFDVFPVDDKPHGRANLVNAFVSGSSGIDMQQLVFRIVNHFKDM